MTRHSFQLIPADTTMMKVIALFLFFIVAASANSVAPVRNEKNQCAVSHSHTSLGQAFYLGNVYR